LQNIKRKITKIIEEREKALHYKTRIVCRELECWYSGDLNAIESAYPSIKVSKLKNKAKFRNPDVLNGKDEIKKWIKPYGAIDAANSITPFMDLDRNQSNSFKQTINAIKNLLSN